MKILDHIPEGWRVVIGAINAPNGYRYINNNKSRFSGEKDRFKQDKNCFLLHWKEK